MALQMMGLTNTEEKTFLLKACSWLKLAGFKLPFS
jgi:hypothetical protein